jgi:tetratricopeptide (TPR) repeat protein
MLPSAYFLKKDCKVIINKCIKISEELNLENGTKRLLLYLYSIDEKPEINPDEFINTENELQGEAYFLKGLKNNHMQSFEKALENYNDLIKKDINRIDIKKKISYI